MDSQFALGKALLEMRVDEVTKKMVEEDSDDPKAMDIAHDMQALVFLLGKLKSDLFKKLVLLFTAGIMLEGSNFIEHMKDFEDKMKNKYSL